MRKVTIEDISQRTGLSRGTVSRAINNRPDISEVTKRRVLEACRELNYVPNHAARSLATGRNLAVAALVDDLSSYLCTSILRGLAQAAETAGYAVQLIELGRDPNVATERARALSAVRIDGVLIACEVPAPAAATLAEVLRNRAAAAILPVPGIAADLFAPDFREAGRVAARHLLEAAGRQLLYVDRACAWGATPRMEGFIEVCRERGCDPKVITLDRDESLDPAALPVEPICEARGIACADDYLAVNVLVAAAARGRMAGREYALVGQGNEPVAQRLAPGLTSVDFSGEEIGGRAFGAVLQRIAGERMDAPAEVLVAPRLVARSTSRL